MSYDNTNRGALFKNEGDKKRDGGPDYSGNLNVDGDDFFLDAWIKTAQSGRKYMSVSIKRKQANAPPPPTATRQAPQRQAPRGVPQSSTGFDDMNDDIPFASNVMTFDMEPRLTRRMRKWG